MALREAFEARLESLPGPRRVLSQTLALDHFQHRESGDAGNRIAAGGAEEVGVRGEALGELAANHDRSDGMAVPDRLAEGDDVRDHSSSLEAPHVRTAAPEARLYFVRDEEPAGGSYPCAHPVEIAGRGIDDAVAAEHGFHEHRGRGMAGGRQTLERRVGKGRVTFAPIRDAAIPRSAILVGRRQGRDVSGPLGGTRILFGRKRNEGIGEPMIGPLHDQRALVARAGFRDAPREVVGLTAGRDHETGVELRRHRGGEAFGVLHQRLVEVARVGVEGSYLPGDRIHYPRVAVADLGHVVVRVEPALPVRTVEPDPLSPHHVHGVVVAELEAG